MKKKFFEWEIIGLIYLDLQCFDILVSSLFWAIPFSFFANFMTEPDWDLKTMREEPDERWERYFSAHLIRSANVSFLSIIDNIWEREGFLANDIKLSIKYDILGKLCIS